MRQDGAGVRGGVSRAGGRGKRARWGGEAKAWRAAATAAVEERRAGGVESLLWAFEPQFVVVELHTAQDGGR
ncbi:hypothetical protein GALMADRAFT_1162842 [Galerina marginata CBS 339.88]|uniref:Uncharacterized protein n=1 Tax=Galerina marginata (strain CBS 339.88) TaxID=685588 RepID=A0A067T942_GALM3|nr:hypothetical protein GALMADRAFT_1162842 [Galerina marginata CBS 339.88]